MDILKGLPRKSLQALAKTHRIRANMKSEKIIEELKLVSTEEIIEELKKLEMSPPPPADDAPSSPRRSSRARSKRSAEPFPQTRPRTRRTTGKASDTSKTADKKVIPSIPPPDGHPCSFEEDKMLYKAVVYRIYGINLDDYPGLIIRNQDFTAPGEYEWDETEGFNLSQKKDENSKAGECRTRVKNYSEDNGTCVINDTNKFPTDKTALNICVYAPASQVLSQGYHRKGRLAYGSGCKEYNNYLTNIIKNIDAKKPTLIYNNTIPKYNKQTLQSVLEQINSEARRHPLSPEKAKWLDKYWIKDFESTLEQEKLVETRLSTSYSKYDHKILSNIHLYNIKDYSLTFNNIYLLGIPGIGKTHSLRDILKILYKTVKTGNSGGLTIEPTLEALWGKPSPPPPSSEQVLFEAGSLSSSRSTRKSRRKSDTVGNKSVLHNTKKKYHSA